MTHPDTVIIPAVTQFSAANRMWIFCETRYSIQNFGNILPGNFIHLFAGGLFPDDFK